MTITAAFVAEARRVYEPAARWIRENPEWDRPRLQRWDRSIAIHLQGGWHMGTRYEEMILVRPEPPTRETFAPGSLAQAVDYLVAAGVLPVEFHSLAPKPDPHPPVVDDDGDTWVWQGGGYYCGREFGTRSPRNLQQIDSAFGLTKHRAQLAGKPAVLARCLWLGGCDEPQQATDTNWLLCADHLTEIGR